MIDERPKRPAAECSRQERVKTSLTDSPLMIETGWRLGAPTLMIGLCSRLLQATCAKGCASKDAVAFCEVLRGMAGLEQRRDIDAVPFDRKSRGHPKRATTSPDPPPATRRCRTRERRRRNGYFARGMTGSSRYDSCSPPAYTVLVPVL